MNESDYATHRMLYCAACKRAGDNVGPGPYDICHGTNNDIDNCIDATTPIDDFGYVYGA